MVRRLICLMLCVLLLCVSLAGCTPKNAAIVISGAQVSKGEYSYYLDYVLSHPESAGLTDEYTKSDAMAAAKQLCARHIAISSICEREGFVLSNIEKADVASQIEDNWSFFGDYYDSIGVSKQDFAEIMTNAAKKDMIINSYYGSDGEKPVSNDELLQAFNESYVGFKAITGYLTTINKDGSVGTYTKEQLDKIYSNFDDMAAQVNSGTDINKLNTSYNESQGLSGPGELSINIIDESDATYVDGFFDKVSEIETGKAAVIKTDNYIYVILRMNISSDEYLAQYKAKVLETLKSDDIDRLIGDWINEHPKISTGSLGDIYKTVSEKHDSQESTTQLQNEEVASVETTAVEQTAG